MTAALDSRSDVLVVFPLSSPPSSICCVVAMSGFDRDAMAGAISGGDLGGRPIPLQVRE